MEDELPRMEDELPRMEDELPRMDEAMDDRMALPRMPEARECMEERGRMDELPRMLDELGRRWASASANRPPTSPSAPHSASASDSGASSPRRRAIVR